MVLPAPDGPTNAAICPGSIVKLMSWSTWRGTVVSSRATDRTILERGLARGDVRAGVDLDFFIDVLYGPVYHRVLLTGLPVSGQFIDALVDSVFGALASPG